MRSLFVALATAALVFGLIAAATKSTYAWLPAISALIATYILVARRFGKKIEALMEKSAVEIQAQRIDNAIAIIESGYQHAPWVFLMRSQIDGQIGTLHYLQKDWDRALPLLESAWIKHWIAKAMLACYWWRKHKSETSFEILDKAIAANKKEPLLYGIKAWMQAKLKDRDAARATLTLGKEATKGNDGISENLIRLQNGEDLRMHLFGEAWYQFHLEKPSQRAMMKMAGGGGLNPKGAKKSMYR